MTARIRRCRSPSSDPSSSDPSRCSSVTPGSCLIARLRAIRLAGDHPLPPGWSRHRPDHAPGSRCEPRFTAPAVGPAAGRTGWEVVSGSPGEVGGPVGLPGLAPVGGEGLFPAAGIVAGDGPLVADADRAAVPVLVVVEAADAVLVEAADRRREPEAHIVAGPVDRPELGTGVEEAQGEADVALVGESDLVDVAGAVEDAPAAGDAVEFVPVVASGEDVAEAALFGGPGADQEIEVVRHAGTVGRLH